MIKVKKVTKRIKAFALIAIMLVGIVQSSPIVTKAEETNNLAASMKLTEQGSGTPGKWMSGEYHSHTNQSNDATVSSSKVENMLDIAYHEGNYTNISGASNITNGTGLDYFFLADHFRKSVADADGNSYTSDKYTPRYIGIEQQLNKFNQLQAQGKYKNKIFSSGFEWDMPGLDHAAVGIIDSNSDNVPIQAIRQFEWLYADQSNDPDSLYENNGIQELANYGARKATSSGGRSSVEVAYDGLTWLKNNYPDSYVLINHPSRHNGGSGVVTAKNLREMNDIAPNMVFGFEGMPGNQLSPDGTRCELNDIYGGADVMLANVGGIWDSLLGEGRHFYNFTNSDCHFKTNGTNSSGYYPGEYSRNYTFVKPGMDNNFDYKDVVEGLRSGNSFSVYGDLINALDFTATSGSSTAVMGSDLNADTNDKVNLTIRFKSPSENNYAQFTSHSTDVTNHVSVDHVDLICGDITGKLSTSDYGNGTNTTTKILKTFYKADWGTPDAEGYYTIHYVVTADKSKYYRLRGTNLAAGTVGYTDAEGNPLKDIAYTKTSVPDFNTRVNQLNDRNYKSLWFYSNPIFVYAKDSTDAFLSNINMSFGTLTPAFDSNTTHYTAEVPNQVNSIDVIPTANNSHASVMIQGTQVVTGAAVSLNVGSNEIHIGVTAQDNVTKSDYVISVTRKEDSGTKSIAVGGQNGVITAGTDQSVTFQAATSKIAIGTPVSVNWCDVNGKAAIAPPGVSLSASPVAASGSSITVAIAATASAGRYYFIATSDGVSSSVNTLTITAPVPNNTAPTGDSNASQTTTLPNIEIIHADIKPGDTDSTVSQILIERTKKEDGQKKDTVTYQKNNAIDTVNRLKERNEDTARIVIPDEQNEVSDTTVNIPFEAIDVLSAGTINLTVETQEAEIALSKETLNKISKESKNDLYFHIVPVTEETEKKALENNAVLAVSLVNGNTKGNAVVVGNPIAIETNRTSLDADITLPLTGVVIPSDKEEREAYLKQLAVYIKHSDGSEELVPGKIVEVSDGGYAIRFQITKFSSFAIIKTDAFVKSSACSIAKVTIPAKTVLNKNTMKATVANKVSSTNVKITVSDKAVWKMYRDKACTKVVSDNKLKLKIGANKAYIKVTAEDGTFRIYTLTVTRSKSKEVKVTKVVTKAKAVAKGK